MYWLRISEVRPAMYAHNFHLYLALESKLNSAVFQNLTTDVYTICQLLSFSPPPVSQMPKFWNKSLTVIRNEFRDPWNLWNDTYIELCTFSSLPPTRCHNFEIESKSLLEMNSKATGTYETTSIWHFFKFQNLAFRRYHPVRNGGQIAIRNEFSNPWNLWKDIHIAFFKILSSAPSQVS